MNDITITIGLAELKAARQKYLQLGGEIEDRDEYPNLQHSHSKLGIFLAEVLGYDLWKTVEDMRPEDADERAIRADWHVVGNDMKEAIKSMDIK